MSYPELAAVILAAVSVIVTVLGVFVAVLAIWGYSQFQKTARAAARNHIAKEIADGGLKSEIENLVVSHITKELSSNRLKNILEARVDRLIYSNAEERASRSSKKDNDENEMDI